MSSAGSAALPSRRCRRPSSRLARAEKRGLRLFFENYSVSFQAPPVLSYAYSVPEAGGISF